MSKYALMFHRRDCMGCHACEVACKQEHGLGVGPRLVRVFERAPDFFPVYCHHCTRAPCLESCPVDAIIKDAQGLVLIDDDLCIGCKECMPACPFGAMQFDDDGAVAVKCDLCADRLLEGQGPACGSVCPTRCISWGETGDLADRLAREALPQRMK